MALVARLLALRREIGERRREERAAEAEADQVDFLLSGCLLDRLQRGERPFVEIILERLLREALVGIHPRDDEHRVALIDCPLHEGILVAQIEDVVTC